jgi:hypothetical protein
MSFYKEPTQYEKTALSDLQGAWTILRDAVVENFGFPGSDKIIFHIDEAMSWECVRDLNRMYPLINSVDFRSRHAKRIEHGNEGLLSEVLSILDACIY